MKLSLSFHGAVGKTTGSSHLLQAGKTQILLDCGLDQEIPYQDNKLITFDPRKIDYVIVSHAHIDHTGRLPLLIKEGFEGPIYCTGATRDLTEILLQDSVEIAYEEAKRAQEIGRRPIKPLYDLEDVDKTLKQMVVVPYHERTSLEQDCSFTFYDAGHILGSAQVVIDCDGTKIAFTGDLGQDGSPILRNPEPLPRIHYLITESTYGSKSHPSMERAANKLIKYAKYISENGGKLVIPSFAVGRTQRLIYYLNEVFEKGRIDRTPVYIDSPLAIDATEIFLKHPECYDKETHQLLASGDNPLRFPELSFSKSWYDSKRILQGWETCIVFAGSGMCTGGRIINHLKNDLPMKKSMVLFVGYQAKGTLGREILDGADSIEINNRRYAVRSKVEAISGFSAHADKNELKMHIARLPRKPWKTFVVHGEAEHSLTFAANLRNTLDLWARVPTPQKKYSLKSR
jgi:metallo-beta-lactamase family protein